MMTSQRVDFGVGLLNQGGPEHIWEVLGSAADGRVAVAPVPARRPDRHVVVNLDPHPRPVLEQAGDIHRPPRVPAVEELASQFRSERDRLQRLDQVAVVQSSLQDSTHVCAVRARLVEQVAGVCVVSKVMQTNPGAVAGVVKHVARNGCLPQLRRFSVKVPADEILLVVRRKRVDAVRRHRAPQLEVGEHGGVVRPASVRAQPGNLALVDRLTDVLHMDDGELLLLHAIALGVKPTLVVNLDTMLDPTACRGRRWNGRSLHVVPGAGGVLRAKNVSAGHWMPGLRTVLQLHGRTAR
mmetsp:Transcript_32754/g.83134  ORF Transcript_32754/g.83134 Transcript_32754/m.83134 type:complete len:296 (+) Transcript_32754:1372-2259(+)